MRWRGHALNVLKVMTGQTDTWPMTQTATIEYGVEPFGPLSVVTHTTPYLLTVDHTYEPDLEAGPPWDFEVHWDEAVKYAHSLGWEPMSDFPQVDVSGFEIYVLQRVGKVNA